MPDGILVDIHDDIIRKTIISNLEGGCGKSAIAMHLARRGEEKGLRVLVIDADEQSDVTTRLTGNDAPDPGQAIEFGERSLVVWAPDYRSPAEAEQKYDLVIVDAPKDGLQDFRASARGASRVYIPVSNVDAAKNSVHIVKAARQAGLPARIVFNKVGFAGVRYDRRMLEIEQRLPEGVKTLRTRIVAGASIQRSDETGLPAWRDQWPGQGGESMLRFCDFVLKTLFPALYADAKQVQAT